MKPLYFGNLICGLGIVVLGALCANGEAVRTKTIEFPEKHPLVTINLPEGFEVKSQTDEDMAAANKGDIFVVKVHLLTGTVKDEGDALAQYEKAVASELSRQYHGAFTTWENPLKREFNDIKWQTTVGTITGQIACHIAVFTPDGKTYLGLEVSGDRLSEREWKKADTLLDSIKPKAASTSSANSSSAGEKKAIEPATLAAFLPKKPEGWKMLPPSAELKKTGSSVTPEASTTYMNDKQATTDILIRDTAADKQARHDTEAAMADTIRNNNQREGYAKEVTVEGFRGWEMYRNEEKSGGLFLLVGDRIELKIETSGQGPEAVREWVQRIDLKKLADLK